MTFSPCKLLLFLMIACSGLRGETVIEKFDAAKQEAASEGKDIILGFAGYRWWWMTDAIADKTDNEWLNEHFIILNVPACETSVGAEGFPSAAEKAVIELRNRFHQKIEEPYPAILLLDATGRPYGELDSHEQPPSVYVEELKAALKFASSAKSVGDLVR